MLNNSPKLNTYVNRIQQGFTNKCLIDSRTGRAFRPVYWDSPRHIARLAYALMTVEAHAHQSSQNAK